MILTLKPTIRALFFASISTILFAIHLVSIEVVQVVHEPIFYVINGVSMLLCWALLSILMTRYSVLIILCGLSLLVVAGLADYHLPISKNPITLPLILLFWLGAAYLIQPQFFTKNRIAIISVYGLLMSYYFFHLLTTSDYGPEDRGSVAKFILLPIPAFVVVWLYDQWRWLKTLKSEKADAELALLKSQINPHFFFNTLNNLYGLVVEKSDQAPEVVLRLSDMMRYTIYEGKKDQVSLADEVNYLETYIELHKIRHQKKVDIQFIHTIDDRLRVAPLLFIILLENAFKHGVDKMRQHSFIHLKMISEAKNITFEIKNNFNQSASTDSNGIGLENLKRRLNYIYPNQHELIMQKTDSVFTVTLKLSTP